jgi:ribosome-interacting GTPase 1
MLQVDMATMEEVEEIGRRANSIPISCSLQLNMDGLLERIWEMMALVRMNTCPLLPPLCFMTQRVCV